MDNVNKGHRERLRQRFLKEGLENFQEHEVLELLLFQYLPYKDTNKISHDLLAKFGSLSNVLDATASQLKSVKGISDVTAINLSVLKCVWQRYKQSTLEKVKLDSIASIVRFSRTLIADNYAEKLIAVYVNNATEYISKAAFSSDDTQRVNVDNKAIVSEAMNFNAAGVLLFHCHVKGLCEPSDEDIQFTNKLYVALASINIVLLEHIIFNEKGDFYSFYQNGHIRRFNEKYKLLNN